MSAPKSVAAGWGHTCELLADGTVQCVGDNGYGELGLGTYGGTYTTPIAVTGLSGVTAISGNYAWTCALMSDQTVRCWGYGYGPSPVAISGVSGAVSVSASGGSWSHACAVLSTGNVSCWGDNSWGQLGNGTSTGPGANAGSTTAVQVSNITSAIAVAAHAHGTCALLSNGTVQCWGANIAGELGTGTTGAPSTCYAPYNWPCSTFPAGPVSGLSNVVAIAAGDGDFVCALRSNGTVSCWGDNSNGQLGDGTTTLRAAPVAVSGLSGSVTAIAAGQEHSCAVLSSGAVQCWGSNASGQLGDGTTTNSFAPASVLGVSGATIISAGNSHTCALLSSGAVTCWGQNTYGQLGDGTLVSSPVAQGSSPGLTPIAVAAGWGHSCELFPDGTVQCWGDNGYGELGQGIYGSTFASPMPVSGLGSATGISGSYAWTCALMSDQTVRCWGYGYGPSPVAISGVSGAVSVSASGGSWSHACAVLSTGKVSCWGDNSWGQLGNGTSTGPGANAGSTTAVEVSNITSAIAVAAHAHGTCALLSNGTVQCWGANIAGELGIGTTTAPSTCYAPYNWPCSTVPAGTVSGLSSAVAIAAGDGDFVCALSSNGTVSCWGDNSNGQLGDGTTTLRSAPVAVSGLSGSVTAIAAGQEHSCAMLSSGAVQCWGSNTSGQLGNGGTTSSSTPVSVAGVSGAMTISAGNSHTCALLSGGGSQCWGDNTYGQLGNRATGSSSVPVATCIPGGCVDPSGLACQSTAIARMPVNPSQPFDLASDGASLFWTDTASGTVASAALNGTAPTTVVSGVPGIGGIAVDTTSLYFTDIAQGTVSSVPKSGGTPQTLAAGQRVPRFVVSDGDHLMWTNQGTARTDGSVRQLTKSTGQLAALADGQPGPWTIASMGGVAYWSDTLAGSVFAASPAASIQTIASGLAAPSLVTGGTEPYFSSTDGRLFDFSVASQQVVPRAAAAAGAFSLAASGSSLFWTNGLQDTVSQQLTSVEFPSTIWRRPETSTPRIIKALAGALWFSVAAPTSTGSIFTFVPGTALTIAGGAPACAPAGPGAVPSMACQRAAAAIVPLLECVVQMPDNSLVAHFGYTNLDSVARRLGVGAENQLDRSDGDGCQPTTFAPGTHHDVFAVGFVDEISWKVGQRSATALSISPRCWAGAVSNTEVSP